MENEVVEWMEVHSDAHHAFVEICDRALQVIRDPIEGDERKTKFERLINEFLTSISEAGTNLSLQTRASRVKLFKNKTLFNENLLLFVQSKVNLFWYFSEICARLEESAKLATKKELCLSLCKKTGIVFSNLFEQLPSLELADIVRAVSTLQRCYNIAQIFHVYPSELISLIFTSFKICQNLAKTSSVRLAEEIIKAPLFKYLLITASDNTQDKLCILSARLLNDTIFSYPSVSKFFSNDNFYTPGKNILLDTLLHLLSVPKLSDVPLAGIYGAKILAEQLSKFKLAPLVIQNYRYILELLSEKLVSIKNIETNNLALLYVTEYVIQASELLNTKNVPVLHSLVPLLATSNTLGGEKLKKILTKCSHIMDIDNCMILVKALLSNIHLATAETIFDFSIRFMDLLNIIKTHLDSHQLNYSNEELFNFLEYVSPAIHRTQELSLINALKFCIEDNYPPEGSQSFGLLLFIDIILRSKKCGCMAIDTINFLHRKLAEYDANSCPNYLEPVLCCLLTVVKFYPLKCHSLFTTTLDLLLPILQTKPQFTPKCKYLAACISIQILSLIPPSPITILLLSQLLKMSNADSCTSFDFIYSNISSESLPAAVWKLILDSLPVLEISSNSADIIETFTSRLTSSLLLHDITYDQYSIANLTLSFVETQYIYEFPHLSKCYVNKLVFILFDKLIPTKNCSSPDFLKLLKLLATAPHQKLKDCIKFEHVDTLESILISQLKRKSDSLFPFFKLSAFCLCNLIHSLSPILSMPSECPREQAIFTINVDTSLSLKWILVSFEIVNLIADMSSSGISIQDETLLDAAVEALINEMTCLFNNIKYSESFTECAFSIFQRGSSMFTYLNMLKLSLSACTYIAKLPTSQLSEKICNAFSEYLESAICKIEAYISEHLNESSEFTNSNDLLKTRIKTINPICKTILLLMGMNVNNNCITPAKIQRISSSLLSLLKKNQILLSFDTILLVIELISKFKIDVINHLILTFSSHLPDISSSTTSQLPEFIALTQSFVSRLVKSQQNNVTVSQLSLLESHFSKLIFDNVSNLHYHSNRSQLIANIKFQKCVSGEIILIHVIFNSLPSNITNQCNFFTSILSCLKLAADFLNHHSIVRVFDFWRRIAYLKHIKMESESIQVIMGIINSVLLKIPPSKSHNFGNTIKSICALLNTLISVRYKLMAQLIPTVNTSVRLLLNPFISNEWCRSQIYRNYTHSSVKRIHHDCIMDVLSLVYTLTSRKAPKNTSVTVPHKKYISRHISFLISSILVTFSQSFESIRGTKTSEIVIEILLALQKSCPDTHNRSAIFGAASSVHKGPALEHIIELLRKKASHYGS